MNIERKDLPAGEVSLRITVTEEEARPFITRAAGRLSAKHNIPGFRPGKAPVAMTTAQLGEGAVYQEASHEIVTTTLWRAIKEQKLETVGQPKISVESAAPKEPMVYSAVLTLMPDIKLSSWQDLRLSAPKVTLDEAEVQKVITEARQESASEVLVLRPAKSGDRVEVNFTVKRDEVVIEGGEGKKFPVILGSSSLIPGFEEQIIGLSAGQKREFDLRFPTPYYQASLSGAEAHFAVELLAVYERSLPAADDSWAQTLGAKDLGALTADIRKSLEQQKNATAQNQHEEQVLEQLGKRATISAIPEFMVHSEVDKMTQELKGDVTRRGMDWEKYLSSIKQTDETLRQEFRPRAIKRITSALIVRTIASELAIEVSGQELESELDQQKMRYREQPEIMNYIDQPDYQHQVKILLTHRKTMQEILRRVQA